MLPQKSNDIAFLIIRIISDPLILLEAFSCIFGNCVFCVGSILFSLFDHLTCRRASLTCGRRCLTCGKASLTSRRASLTCGRASLACGRASLTCGRASLTCGSVSLTCERASLTSGRASLTCGRASLTWGRASRSLCWPSTCKCLHFVRKVPIFDYVSPWRSFIGFLIRFGPDHGKNSRYLYFQIAISNFVAKIYLLFHITF